MDAFPIVLDDLMMAQQPIFNKTKELFGYELLFRDKDPLNANVFNGDKATSQVLVNLCIGITKLESQVKKPFFINMTTELMLSEAFFPIAPDTMYIEILEGQNITTEFIAAIQKWRDLGYRFVLDDYQFSAAYKVLLPWVSIVKVDVLATPPLQYLKEITELKMMGIILIAEKVEDLTMFELCSSLGFDLFQGYFLQRPEIIKGKKINSNTMSAIALVNALQNENITIPMISELVAQNPQLTFQVLRILKSPICGISKKAASIKDAITFLGLEQLKKWALLITLTSSSNQPNSLLKIVLTRSRCCQLLAKQRNPALADSAFMTGLMSGINIVFNVEQSVILNQISLTEEVLEAILNKSGELGSYLAQTLSCEEQDWEKLQAMCAEDRTSLNRAFLDAMLWGEDILQTLS